MSCPVLKMPDWIDIIRKSFVESMPGLVSANDKESPSLTVEASVTSTRK